MIRALSAKRTPFPWIRDASFDSFFILGLMSIALASGALVMLEPQLFYPILVLDLWVLGYHHVISTYTRLCFDKESFQNHKSLIFGLGPVVIVTTLMVAAIFGLWAIVSIYFYWQWWHYTRQSWGISRIYRAKDQGALFEQSWLDQAIFYCIPVYGVLLRSTQGHEKFIGLDLKLIPIPDLITEGAGYSVLALTCLWICRRVIALIQERLAVVHSLYLLSHFTVFSFAYIFIEDITFGWLVINIWHNAQYILFVWVFNTKRFKDGVDPQARFLSYISQPGRLWLYLLTCLGITGVIYWGILRAIDWVFFAGVSATLVLYQIVNFHHYVVDTLIWKVRKPHMQTTLEIKS